MYSFKNSPPPVKDFLRLRHVTEMSARSIEAAKKGLPNSLFAVTVYFEDTAIGMGRVVGDGGCNYLIIDIAVEPIHQGKGLGRQIMQRIMDYIEETAPVGAHVALLADVPELYEKFGFKCTAPDSVGMALIKS